MLQQIANGAIVEWWLLMGRHLLQMRRSRRWRCVGERWCVRNWWRVSVTTSLAASVAVDVGRCGCLCGKLQPAAGQVCVLMSEPMSVLLSELMRAIVSELVWVLPSGVLSVLLSEKLSVPLLELTWVLSSEVLSVLLSEPLSVLLSELMALPGMVLDTVLAESSLNRMSPLHIY